ncbi:OLC1v1005676C1 [Oldenlandia corymbosa var. corymbosa]|uniref:OLC1v1005676C1 n=1 Tax=Oldenlandia corymbosa var. corymbosa TaxID=529605 RepID=A0AAV1DGF5_OLDCO|nr:OLC1v1005676C1 [Oldenlandia corymbosa var. corymbosa]
MLLKALAGIHSKGIVHCDLKPGNVLIFPAVCGGRHINMLKLADFGSARRLSEEEQLMETDSGGTKTYTKTTLPYASPESVSSGVHGTGTDIWSFGCIVIEMITGQRAYNYRDNDDLVHQILHECIFVPGRLSNMDGVDFLMRCFDRDPKYRWSALKLLNHPFIVNNLKIMSQIHGVDFNKIEDTNHSQKNPFGRFDWVTKQHLFSKGQQQQQLLVHHHLHHHQEEARRQPPLQFQPNVRFPVRNGHQLPGPTALNH